MNVYCLFVGGKAPFYVRASYSHVAVRVVEAMGFRVSGWDMATSIPEGATIHDA